jgi:hypothetical protein
MYDLMLFLMFGDNVVAMSVDVRDHAPGGVGGGKRTLRK